MPQRFLLFLPMTLLLLVAGCGRGADPAPDAVDVTHVHALEVDPEDPDRVYVATHEGLALYTERDGVQRVGDLRSDLMGFAVGPEGMFYASGHPGHGEDGPAALGLIQSADAGLSWSSVGLVGEADFHALEAGRRGVYGVDAATGVLRVSRDGRSWTDVPTEEGFIDLAIDPVTGDLLGTTGTARLVRSSDGGRTFAPEPGAPPLVLVDSVTDGGLVGIDPGGRIHRSTGEGRWQLSGGRADSELQALAAGQGGRVWVLDGEGLRRSNDGGATFEAAPGW